ncbi:hypothetical protein [uncultured Desulfobacter sp.]|uniref:hypothetical protein n=1 Tax=uncultured Desulfobacter sp. TaxID=240139 RepID=UPI002AAC08E0|nr:hypothetical protein [uncultured Desulfobacter sp.]
MIDPKEIYLDKCAHLRAVHFTLLVVSIAISFFLITNRTDTITNASNQINKLEEIFKVRKKVDLDNYVSTKFDEYFDLYEKGKKHIYYWPQSKIFFDATPLYTTIFTRLNLKNDFSRGYRWNKVEAGTYPLSDLGYYNDRDLNELPHTISQYAELYEQLYSGVVFFPSGVAHNFNGETDVYIGKISKESSDYFLNQFSRGLGFLDYNKEQEQIKVTLGGVDRDKINVVLNKTKLLTKNIPKAKEEAFSISRIYWIEPEDRHFSQSENINSLKYTFLKQPFLCIVYSKDNTSYLAIHRPFKQYDKKFNLIEPMYEHLKYKHTPNSFSEEFPDLFNISQHIMDSPVEGIRKHLIELNGVYSSEISFMGLKLKKRDLATFGGFVILFISIYFYIHLSSLHRLGNPEIDPDLLPWLALYPVKFSQIFSVLSLILIPISAQGIIFISGMEYTVAINLMIGLIQIGVVSLTIYQLHLVKVVLNAEKIHLTKPFSGRAKGARR